MNREEFTAFVDTMLEELVVLAEEKSGRTLPRKMEFQWLGKDMVRVAEGITEHIVSRVFVDDDHIYSCVDMAVADLVRDDTLLVVGHVSEYPSTPFAKNWTGRDGPFVYLVGGPLLSRVAGKPVDWSPESGSFGSITPGLTSKQATETKHPTPARKQRVWDRLRCLVGG